MGAPAFICGKMAQIFHFLLLLPETKIKQKDALFRENLNVKRTQGLSTRGIPMKTGLGA